MASVAEANSLLEIDMELDELLDEMEQQVETEGQASEDLVARFQQFCEAHGAKVDRIGRFVRMMETREQYCRNEATRLTDRARAAAGKVERTKNMVLYYLLSRDLKKIEGYQFTLRAQKNSQDSVRITDETAVPKCYSTIVARIDGVVWETILSMLPEELARSIPWSDGKRRLTTAMMGFLARWARRLSWRETATTFQTSWESVYRSVEWFVEWGLAHRQLCGVESIGVDEIHWGHGKRADNFLTVIYQIHAGCRRLLWIGKRRSEKTLRRGLKELGPEFVKGLRFVCSDMWNPI